AAEASFPNWDFSDRPRKILDESRKALTDIIQSIAAEEPLEREAAMMSLPPGIGDQVLRKTESGSEEEGDDEDDALSQSGHLLSEASSGGSTGSFQEPEH
ncbi:MAG: hypothetical protein Q9196_007244, partial [Gyalolechia fulgens]